MLSSSLRKLSYSSTYLPTFMFSMLFFFLLPPVERILVDNNEQVGSNNGQQRLIKSFMVAAAEDEAEGKLKKLFIADIKKLLTHNQDFYNTYGSQDEEVDRAFDEAKLAADVIYLYPGLFHRKLQEVNDKIGEALRKAQTENKLKEEMTADGV